MDADRDRFFRAVDRAILANHSRPSGLPLLVAALTEHHAAFRAVSRNPFLAQRGIEIDPRSPDVGTLLVEADRQIPGRVDRATARVQRGDLAHPDTGDVLNDLAEWTLEMHGEVIMVPAQRMPSSTGIAATYRYRASRIG